jgi:hypothetical protein
MTHLSPHFSLGEMTFSLTAISKNIDNTPNALQISRLESLCDNILEPIRQRFNSPVKILSGFRSPKLNDLVGGAATSQHLLGEAADVKVKGVSNAVLWHWIVDNLNYDQCIAEKLLKEYDGAGWIHISHKREGKQRKEALSFVGDKYVKGFQYMEEL